MNQRPAAWSESSRRAFSWVGRHDRAASRHLPAENFSMAAFTFEHSTGTKSPVRA
jgi:hypothetical protein